MKPSLQRAGRKSHRKCSQITRSPGAPLGSSGPAVSFLSSHVSCSGVAQSRWRVGFNLRLQFCHLNGVNTSSRRIQEGEFSGREQGDAMISQDSIREGAGAQRSKCRGLGGSFRDSVPVVRFLGQGIFEEAVGEAE